MTNVLKTKVIRPMTGLAILFAGISWGGWAYYINADSNNALQSALVQGIYSALMTLYMSYSVFFFFKKINRFPLKFIWPTVLTIGHTGLVLVASHIYNNTENVFKTVALPLAVATLYSAFLTDRFQKDAK